MPFGLEDMAYPAEWLVLLLTQYFNRLADALHNKRRGRLPFRLVAVAVAFTASMAAMAGLILLGPPDLAGHSSLWEITQASVSRWPFDKQIYSN